MHLTPRYINILLNILLGVAWAIALFGFFYGFESAHSNFFFRLLNGAIHSLIGLFVVLVLEAIYYIFKTNQEISKLNKELQKSD
jgi:hypothetical protein